MMIAIRRARRFVLATPAAAVGDAAGLAALIGLIFAGFTLPGLF